MTYVDGFVLVVPKKGLKAYRKMARMGGKLWMKHGALEYFECIGDDLHPNMGGMKSSSFPEMTKVKAGETVWFSFIVYRSKADRDRINAKVMKDMEAAMDPSEENATPFDMGRLATGGFKVVVEQRR